MPSYHPPERNYSRGYPAALSELSPPDFHITAHINMGLYALLRSAGMAITFCEADVISGHAAQFLYSKLHPECAQLSFVPPTDTLFRALEVNWKEITPSGPVTAMETIQKWILNGYPVLARLQEPLLIFGYSASVPDQCVHAARIREGLTEKTISLSEIDKKYWRYPLDEGNVLLCVEEAPHGIANLNPLASAAARRAVRLWHFPELAGCHSGDAAYRRFHADLMDFDTDFSDEKSRPWMGFALWKQWTSRASSFKFFDRVAPRFGGSDRNALAKASFCYGQCVDAWQNWARYLGPTWDYAQTGFPDEYPGEFIERWRSRELRVKAAHWVEEARGWEEKAITELKRTIR